MNGEVAKANGGTRDVTREPVFRPNVDIFETKDDLKLIADVPGAGPEDVSIDYENGTLSLRASVKARQPENVRYLLCEYGVGSFYREFLLSEDIDADKITASVKDGVLLINLPKSEKRKPKKIQVRAS